MDQALEAKVAVGVASGEESLIILESLLCLMREKNLLTRADMERLASKVDERAGGAPSQTIPCCAESAHAAAGAMQRLTAFLGHRYGGKHARYLA